MPACWHRRLFWCVLALLAAAEVTGSESEVCTAGFYGPTGERAAELFYTYKHPTQPGSFTPVADIILDDSPQISITSDGKYLTFVTADSTGFLLDRIDVSSGGGNAFSRQPTIKFHISKNHDYGVMSLTQMSAAFSPVHNTTLAATYTGIREEDLTSTIKKKRNRVLVADYEDLNAAIMLRDNYFTEYYNSGSSWQVQDYYLEYNPVQFTPTGTHVVYAYSSIGEEQIVDTFSNDLRTGDEPYSPLKIVPDVVCISPVAELSQNHRCTAARSVYRPSAIAVHPNGTFAYVASRDGDRVVRVDFADMSVHAFVGPGLPHEASQGQADPAGALETMDGIGQQARFKGIAGIVFLNDNYALVLEKDNQRLRTVNVETGSVTTVVGACGTVVDSACTGGDESGYVGTLTTALQGYTAGYHPPTAMLSFPMDFAYNPVMDTIYTVQEDSATGAFNAIYLGPSRWPLDAREATCVACPARYSSPDGAATLDECYCDVGFTPDAMGDCQPCPTGSEKNEAGDAPCTCSAGYEPGAQAGTCQACGPNSQKLSAGNTSCVCLAGYTPDVDGACELCPANSEKNAPSNDPCVCSAGYEPDANATGTCTACAAGKLKETPGQHACLDECLSCGQNHYMAVQCLPLGASQCLPCPDHSITVSELPVYAHFDGGSEPAETFDGSGLHHAVSLNLFNASWTLLLKIRKGTDAATGKALVLGRQAPGHNHLEVQLVNGYWQLLVSIDGNLKSDFEATEGTCTPCEQGLEHLYPQNKNATTAYDEIRIHIPRNGVVRFAVNDVETTYGAGAFAWLDTASNVTLAGEVQADAGLACSIAGFYAYNRDLSLHEAADEFAKIKANLHDAVYKTVAARGEASASVCLCTEGFYGDGEAGCRACPKGTDSVFNTTLKDDCVGQRCDANEYWDEAFGGCQPCPANSTSAYGDNDCACAETDFPTTETQVTVVPNDYGERWEFYKRRVPDRDGHGFAYIQDFSLTMSADSAYIWMSLPFGFQKYTPEGDRVGGFGVGLGWPVFHLKMSHDGNYFFGCAPVLKDGGYVYNNDFSKTKSKVYKWEINQDHPQELEIDGFCGNFDTYDYWYVNTLEGNVLMSNDGSFVLVYSREHHTNSYRTWLYKISVESFTVMQTIDFGTGTTPEHRSYNPITTMALSKDDQQIYYQYKKYDGVNSCTVTRDSSTSDSCCRIFVEYLSNDIDPTQDTQLAVNDGQCDQTTNDFRNGYDYWTPRSFLLSSDGNLLYQLKIYNNQMQIYSFDIRTGEYAHETPVRTLEGTEQMLINSWEMSPDRNFVLVGARDNYGIGRFAIYSTGGDVSAVTTASCSPCPANSSPQYGVELQSVFEPRTAADCKCNPGFFGNATGEGCQVCGAKLFVP